MTPQMIALTSFIRALARSAGVAGSVWMRTTGEFRQLMSCHQNFCRDNFCRLNFLLALALSPAMASCEIAQEVTCEGANCEVFVRLIGQDMTVPADQLQNWNVFAICKCGAYTSCKEAVSAVFSNKNISVPRFDFYKNISDDRQKLLILTRSEIIRITYPRKKPWITEDFEEICMQVSGTSTIDLRK